MTVSRELHASVLQRDGMCFIRLRCDAHHRCRDGFGSEHAADDLRKLTVDHVHLEGGKMGKRAPDDAQHMVAMCAKSNIEGPSRKVREAERAYLKDLYQRQDA